MNRELLWQTRYVRGVLALTIFLGVLAAGVTVIQMLFLSKIVNQVFWVHQSLYQFVPLILLLLGSIIVHAGLVWLRGMVAQHGAIRAKSELRERLFSHLLHLGPAYCNGERTGELVATANDGIERLDAYISRCLPQIYLSVLIPLWLTLVCGVGGVLLGLVVYSAFGGNGSPGVDWTRWIISVIIAAVLVVIASSITGRNNRRRGLLNR